MKVLKKMQFSHVALSSRLEQTLAARMCAIVCVITLTLFWVAPVSADPVTFYQSFAGNLDITGTGGTLRSQSDAGDPCALNPTSTGNLSGIPASASITAAYLYWAGSYDGNPVNIDTQVTFAGTTINASRTFTELFVFGGNNYDFFSGFANVTALVDANRNGNYTLGNLTVNAGAPHCGVSAVLAGWGMVVVYDDAAEPVRVLNVYDGMQWFRNSSITMTPSNFLIPATGIDGTATVLSWEGDIGAGGVAENLTFNGTALTDAINPVNNQFNSTNTFTGSTTNYGVDLDSYDVTASLTAGDSSATSVYSAGGDLVMLGLKVISVSNVAVADIGIIKTAPTFARGINNSYTINVSNNGPSASTATSFTVTDTLPTGIAYLNASGTGWSCGAVGQDVTCTHAGGLAAGASIPTLTLNVSVGPAAASISNTANIAHDGSEFDNVAANNNSAVTHSVLSSNLSTSSKTVVDLNGGDADPGDTLRYTITINETAAVAATSVSVTDDIPANVSSFNVVSIPVGASNSSTGSGSGANANGYLNITGIGVPASGSRQIVFDVIVDAVTPGSVIANTATVTNPHGSGAIPDATNVIVSASSIPTSGIKQLYLTTSPAGSMSRVQPAVEPFLQMNGNNISQQWNLTPVLQADLNIDATSGFIPIALQIRRRGAGGSNRTLSMVLESVGPTTSVIGTYGPQVTALTNAFVEHIFSIPIAADVNILTGSQLRLTINNVTGAANRRIRIRANNGGAYSRIDLPTDTVINVDDVSFYDAAYPAGTIQTAASYGDNLFIRAQVSDPFGSFDITSAAIDIIHPDTTVVISAAAMAQVFDSGTATKIYEYNYTLPASGDTGAWTARVSANEGAEGIISHIRSAGIPVGYPDLSILKLAQTTSDPINGSTNPKAIPGAYVRYTIQPSNQGYGPAASVFITDPVPANTELFVGNLGGGSPVIFTANTSGLTYSFVSLADMSDSVSFSADGGATFTYVPSPDVNGFDAAVTHLRVSPSGLFVHGSPAPSFNVQFRVRVQ